MKPSCAFAFTAGGKIATMFQEGRSSLCCAALDHIVPGADLRASRRQHHHCLRRESCLTEKKRGFWRDGEAFSLEPTFRTCFFWFFGSLPSQQERENPFTQVQVRRGIASKNWVHWDTQPDSRFRRQHHVKTTTTKVQTGCTFLGDLFTKLGGWPRLTAPAAPQGERESQLRSCLMRVVSVGCVVRGAWCACVRGEAGGGRRDGGRERVETVEEGREKG